MDGFVAVHTGAGNCVNDTKYKNVCKESCEIATRILSAGGTALDACEKAIVTLENCGQTNAGYGSNLTWDGKVECEASIMDGKTLQFGACTNLTNVANPISLARLICERQSKLLSMERIPPMILAGDGATEYARRFDLQIVDNATLISKKARKAYDHYRMKVEQYESTFNVNVSALDTVGAVVVDAYGNCVAGCSSGGIVLKLSGRVGQAASYGAGCYALRDDARAIATCTTGNGEYLMKTLLAREIVSDLRTQSCGITSMYNTFKTSFIESPFLQTLEEVYGGALALVYDSSTGDCELLWGQTTKSLCIGYMSTTHDKPRFVHSTLPKNKTPGKSVVVQGKHFKIPI